MKKFGVLLNELGFKKDSDTATQEAFLKHLIKSATGTSVSTPTEKKLVAENSTKNIKLIPTQLQFSFVEDASSAPASLRSRKKRAL